MSQLDKRATSSGLCSSGTFSQSWPLSDYHTWLSDILQFTAEIYQINAKKKKKNNDCVHAHTHTQDTGVGRGQVCRGAAVSIVRQDGWKNWSCLAAGMSAGRVCFYNVFIETGSAHMVIYMHTHLIHTYTMTVNTLFCWIRFTNNLTVV